MVICELNKLNVINFQFFQRKVREVIMIATTKKKRIYQVRSGDEIKSSMTELFESFKVV